MEMKRLGILITLVWAVIACSEETGLRSSDDHLERLAVEAVLTDKGDRPQRVYLSTTVPYFEETTKVSGVSGALVTINDGKEETKFSEIAPGSGIYEAPVGFHGEQGGNYHLKIQTAGGEIYEADAMMPKSGFRIDEVDYAFAGNKTMGLDSLWTLAIWGRDMETTDYYYVTAGVNGNFYPFDLSVVTDDIYFNGNDINGFPLATLTQYSQLKELYGDCCKYLESGDILTLEAMTLSKEYFDYLMAVTLNGAMAAIPLFSPQPANCPTNIRGGDGSGTGFFAACPVISASVTVDDPLRPYYRKALPIF